MKNRVRLSLLLYLVFLGLISIQVESKRCSTPAKNKCSEYEGKCRRYCADFLRIGGFEFKDCQFYCCKTDVDEDSEFTCGVDENKNGRCFDQCYDKSFEIQPVEPFVCPNSEVCCLNTCNDGSGLCTKNKNQCAELEGLPEKDEKGVCKQDQICCLGFNYKKE
ncbi:CLUMA_CG009389, isoform A [Clunio marinus]|uniref:CLUMA_CG009389, isoform A n=1 Tax=Clunio marinus TaxID=568069 RepID=A0A1J1IBY2_9DIPT|nr:CLUMA_CG009389, isoform A [Clunio marinus]